MAVENKIDYINVLNADYQFWKAGKVISAHETNTEALLCKNKGKEYPIANIEGDSWTYVPPEHIDTYKRIITYEKII